MGPLIMMAMIENVIGKEEKEEVGRRGRDKIRKMKVLYSNLVSCSININFTNFQSFLFNKRVAKKSKLLKVLELWSTV